MVFAVIAAVLIAFIAAALAFRVAVGLVIGVGYILFYGGIAAGYVLFAAGWLVWHGSKLAYRLLDWSVDKLAPPIAARWHQWRDERVVPEPVTQKWPPVREANSEVVHWGYGQLNPARTTVRELPKARTSCLVTRRSRRVRAPRRRSLRG